MTCKDCYHYEVCGGFLPSDTDKDLWDLCAKGKSDEIPDIENRCSDFKNKSGVVEVVRCKECQYRYVPCHCALWYASAHRTEYFLARGDDFYCSHGKRKEGVNNG